MIDVKGMYGSELYDAIDKCCIDNGYGDINTYQLLDVAGIECERVCDDNGKFLHVRIDGEEYHRNSYGASLLALQRLGLMSEV